jgi:hypothetical protein
LVTIGLVLMMVLAVGTDGPVEEPTAVDSALGSGAEYPGFQSWEDRAPFMTLMDGPVDTPGFGIYGANLGDVDGDGCDDFVSMDYTETEWSPSWTFTDATMLPGRSDGTFDEGQYEKLGIDILTYGCGDVNGDDRMDVISVSMPRERLWSYGYTNVTFEIRFGGSDGIPATQDQYFSVKPFSEGSTIYYRDPASSVFPVGDVNGDGFDDLMIFSLVDTEDRPVAEFQVFNGSAAGLEKKPRTQAVSLDGPKDYEMWNWTRGITHADVNGDGCSDVIIAHGEPYYWGKWDRPDYLTIHLGSSEGFSPSPDQRIDQEGAENLITAIVPVSFNGDEYDDIAIVEVPAQEVAQGDGMNVSFHTGSVDGLSSSRAYDRPFTIGGGWGRLHVGFSDLDGDGLDDILVLSNTIDDQLEHDGFRLNIYDRRLVLWRNVNASFDDGPWWSDVVQRSTGDHVKIHRGDYDGDGRGDFLVTLSGWEYINGDDAVRSGDGSVILLLGRNSDNIAFPVFLSDGPVLYANHSAYDVIIGEERLPGMELEAIEVRFDPNGADALVRLTRVIDVESDGRWKFYVRPTELIDVEGSIDFTDYRDNSSWASLSIKFGWDWPHEDPCDVELTYNYSSPSGDGGQKTQIVTVPAVFSVENDLDLVGDVVVEGEHQGVIAPGDWVRGGEEVTVSGLRVVYQGTTDVCPPAGVCEVVLYDDEEHNTRVSNPSGDEVVLTLAVDDATDTDDALNITLQALPGLAKGPAPLTFPIRVDADPPVLRDPIPDGDEWISAYPVMVGITADDTDTSGVDASTLEFSFRGSFDYGGWSRTGVYTTSSGPVVDGISYLSLQDGSNYFLKWRVRDLVGNMYTMSDEVQLRIDTRNVTFTDPVPSSDEWFNVSRLLSGVTITDVEGSGIDVTTLQYRVSHLNLSSYGPWQDYTGQHTDAREIEARVYVDLGEGPYNYVQWRAADIAGNGLTVSGHFNIRVDTTPPSFKGFSPTGIQNATEVNVSVLLDDGPTGIGVRKNAFSPLGDEEFYYRVRSKDGPYGEWQPTRIFGTPIFPHGDPHVPTIRYSTKMCHLSATLVGLVEGRENFVQFMASDLLGNGPALSEEYRVSVDTQGPYFYNITPEPEEVLPHPEVAVSVSIGDAFSGLDMDNVRFRYGTEGEGSLGEWLRMPVESVDGEHVGMVTITLDRGKTNYIQFRAVDLVGNVNTSAPKMVWVNRLPVAVIARPTDGSVHTEGNPIYLDPTGSYDADGDELTFTWSIVGEGANEVFEGDRTVPLGPGIYNLTLVVTDVHGGEATASVQVTVEEADEGLSGYLVGLLLVLVVVIVVVLVATYLRFREDEIAPE